MKKIMPIPIIISILVILFIIPMSYAIYRSYSTGGVTIAAASWNVSLNQNNVNNNLTIIPGTHNDTYTLNVTNNSEVDVNYTVVISNLSPGVEVSFDNGTFQQQDVNNTITFTDVGSILYTDTNKTKAHTLTFKANTGATLVTDREVDIDVTIKQIIPS